MPSHPALILVDIQYGLEDPYYGARNNPGAEANAARLLARWRELGAPLVHIQHLSVVPGSPLAADAPGSAHKAEVAPLAGEPVMTKSVNSSFIGTNLEQWLRETGISRLVICGLTTNHCVETTTRMAGNLGFDTTLAHDACATHDRTGPDGTVYPADTIHQISLANLHEEFATIKSMDEILAELH